ncbi:MAG: ROK family transcriptional regulator [Clostridia bacterium]|nr:ROK family transcriptional regulator [Clostridia bacterium]
MKKSDTKSIKSNNTALLYECLRNGALSRAQLAQTSGLSKATVTSIVGDLIAKGALVETGIAEGAGVGRPRTSLAIVADYRYAMGIALHRRRLSVCLVNLAYSIVDSRTFSTADFTSPASALDALYHAATEMCAAHEIEKEKLIGIGVSAPGPLDYRKGIIHTPPGLSLFHGFSVREHLERMSDLPVYLDNNATLLAMHERSLRRGTLQNWIFIVVTDGIGSAFFSDGRLYRGHGGYAGELGHTSVEREGIPCACGNRGCLERYIAMDSLKHHFNFADYHTVVDRAEAGDAAALEILDYIAQILSHALVNYVNLINPEAIVLYGELNYKSELLFGKIEQRIRAHSTVAGIQTVHVLPALMQENATLSSSADAIFEAYFTQKLK